MFQGLGPKKDPSALAEVEFGEKQTLVIHVAFDLHTGINAVEDELSRF